jgi:hypothetical protein
MLCRIDASAPQVKFENGKWKILFEVGDVVPARRLISECLEKKIEAVTLSVDKAFGKRSLDANRLMWAVCTNIGEALGIPKEDVYRKAIRGVGSYTPLPIKAEAVEEFKRIWSGHGTGWFADVVDDSKIQGYKLLFAYEGSSIYDAKKMKRLIDYLIDEANQMGIEVLTERERSLLEEYYAKEDGGSDIEGSTKKS